VTVDDAERFDADAVVDDAVADVALDDDAIDDDELDSDDPDTDDPEGVMLLDEVDNSLVLSVWEPTGEPRVDSALELLNSLDFDDVHQHAAVFDEIHQRLRATLTDVDAPGT